MLLVQRDLVLLGSASHSIFQERRTVAWSRINPKYKGLAEEEHDKREANLYGPGFLEKASKRIEVDKTMEKVSVCGVRKSSPPQKRQRYVNDSSDLRSFLARGTPGLRGHGARRAHQRQQPHQFQFRKHFNPSGDTRSRRRHSQRRTNEAFLGCTLKHTTSYTFRPFPSEPAPTHITSPLPPSTAPPTRRELELLETPSQGRTPKELSMPPHTYTASQVEMEVLKLEQKGAIRRVQPTAGQL